MHAVRYTDFMKVPKKIQITAGLLILAGAAFLLAFSGFKNQGTTPPADKNPVVQQAYWESQVKKLGPQKAYEEFARDVNGQDPGAQHAQAHYFGAALYAAAGVSGLATCDAQFNFGCFHEFLGRAISALGLGQVDSLNQACHDALGSNFLSCQHGIGHGVLAYLGYSRKNLDQALSLCKDLPYNDTIGGCYGGVFMEYNLQTMLGTEARLRPVVADTLYPCDELAPAYQKACMYWQPQWWDQTMRGEGQSDITAIFVELGKRCDMEKDSTLVQFCYEGIGNMTAPSGDFVGSKAAALCRVASSDAHRQLYCLATAANSLSTGGGGEKGQGTDVCKGLTGSYLSYCTAYAENRANILQPLSDPSL